MASAAIDNFQELIDTASFQQREAQLGLGNKARTPMQRRPVSKLKDAEFTLRLVRIPLKKRTMIAGEKLRRAR